ncbi:hypothetical protein FCOIX_6933 [Fusarium coicis]|nr:hypothetical protein FCOIX_6933 [Fusarium coicis]
MPNHSQTSIFTCTFCFHVFQGTPQIIGRTGRLACATCHAALLNLAICWVCGELIYRGDECVSFGWCFWHRAYYGCLLYGSRSIHQGVSVHDLFQESGAEGRVKEGCGGREVTEVPLCAACVVEVEVDGVKEDSVVKRGLRRVEKVDGGLTRKRWEAKNSDKNLKQFSPSQQRIHKNEYGVEAEDLTVNKVLTDFKDKSESVIWVDIFDPINGPSFKPSPLKPMPLFMQRPPSPTIHQRQRRSTAADTYLQPPHDLRKQHSAPCSVCPSESPVRSRSPEHRPPRQPSPTLPKTPPSSPTRSHNSQKIPENDFLDMNDVLEVRHKQAVSWVSVEPLKRPSSRLAPSRRAEANRSEAESSAYRTPPEYPDQVLRTPYPLPLSNIKTASPLPAQLTSHSQRTVHATPQSSEYLDRYQPATTRSTQNQEVRRLRRIDASVSEEGIARTTPGQSEGGEWGSKVGSELRRFFTGR